MKMFILLTCPLFDVIATISHFDIEDALENHIKGSIMNFIIIK